MKQFASFVMSARNYRYLAWSCRWLLLMLIATLPFWWSDLDLRMAASFHVADHPDTPWPLALHPAMQLLYRLGSGLAWLVLGFAAMVFLLPAWRSHIALRRISLTLLATVALGPGLMVNGLGKDFTGRPRPRHVEALGGNVEYRPPLQLGTPGVGKSFPCGHCSVGFAIAAAGFAVFQLRPWLGVGIVLFSALLGGAIGVARMAAGAHFFSDVLWSAIITWAVALIVLLLLRRRVGKPVHPAIPVWVRRVVSAGLVLAVVVGLLFARPFHTDIRVAAESGVQRYRLALDASDLKVVIDPHLSTPLRLVGEMKGYGFPNVDTRQLVQHDREAWHYQLVLTGWVSEVEAPMVLYLRPDMLQTVEVRIGRDPHYRPAADLLKVPLSALPGPG